MARMLYATVIALVGAALVHLAIVLMLPHFSTNDAWRQLENGVEPYIPVRLDRSANGSKLAAAQSVDPMFVVVACRYDLNDGVFVVNAPNIGDFWSVAVFDDFGRAIFSANNRIVVSDTLQLAVALPLQLRSLQQTPREAYADAVFAQTRSSRGFVVLRMFRPDSSWEPVAREFADNIECSANPL